VDFPAQRGGGLGLIEVDPPATFCGESTLTYWIDAGEAMGKNFPCQRQNSGKESSFYTELKWWEESGGDVSETGKFKSGSR
jgi:hypothetical protein